VPPALKQTSSANVYNDLLDQVDQAALTEDLNHYFGPHAQVFLATYAKIRGRRGFSRMMPVTWSWQLLFTSYAWLYYRKLWLTATLTACVMTLSNVLPTMADNALSLALTLLMCVYGKPWYVRTALKQIAKADLLGLSGDARRRHLSQAGGISPLAAALASIAMVLLLMWSNWPILRDAYLLLTAAGGG